jgi:hypothetical protein
MDDGQMHGGCCILLIVLGLYVSFALMAVALGWFLRGWLS